ncbi:MAG: ABC transporter ATP-binding protein [Acidobacteria bacterium]|nr:ABC transporter ATP-binding protein [Acidobacteriota bacterium]
MVVPDAVFEFDRVSKSYATHLSLRRGWILRDLSFAVRAGEIFGYLGPNGAGKTTTIRLALGILFPDGGRIRLFGEPAARVRLRERIGFLPENPYFYDYLSGEEFLDFYARLLGLPAGRRRERIPYLLDLVDLGNRGDRQLRKYSKGMLQRIGLAQALLNEPDLVILDEPMSGLDPMGRRQVRDIILDLRRQGKTIFFSSHILQDAEMICDRVGILDRGRLIACGPLQELLGRRTEFWEVTFSGCRPNLARFQAELVSSGNGESLVRLSAEADLEAFLQEIHALQGSLHALQPQRATLEDFFLSEIRQRRQGGAA